MSRWQAEVTRSLNSPLAWPGVRAPVYANYPLAPCTTWKVGGPARFLAAPQGLDDVYALFGLAHREGWPLFFLGRGSNVLIADAGLPGLTLHLVHSFREVRLSGAAIRAGAGAPLPRLARLAAEAGLSGCEFLAGIPGTVGAAVRLNAGAHGRSLADILTRVWVATPQLQLLELPAASLHLGYRSSLLLHFPHWLVVEAEFILPRRAPAGEIQACMQRFLTERQAKQPSHPRTCGSVFKNPPGGPAAGLLIEAAGLKGRRVGDAQVSGKHANFIINRGHARASDIAQLMAEVADAVQRRQGVRLEREVVCLPDDLA